MEYVIYTDGGCSGNRRNANCPGGFAFIILDPAENIIDQGRGRIENTTNNRMELTAVIYGLVKLKQILANESCLHACIVLSDSTYVCYNYHDYLLEWKRNGWEKANGQRVINVDLWKKIDLFAPEFKSLQFKWVKGHSTNKFNQLVDSMAQGQIMN